MNRRDVILLRAAAIWTVYVWGTRMWIILRDHTKGHGLAFKSVHAVLAIISVAFAVAIWRIASRLKSNTPTEEAVVVHK